MEDVKITDFSDYELASRLEAIKRQEESKKAEVKRQILYQYSADSISAELQRRQREKEQYQKEKRAEENEKIIWLIISITICTLAFLCAFFAAMNA